ncbi:ankyrin repeat domain-containing protein [Saccharicrinis fermentans]|nr:ankyrin repeat domain-containing protein [Saccharicrinis fermentans]
MTKYIISISFLTLLLTNSLSQTKTEPFDPYAMSNLVRSGDTLKLRQAITKYNYDVNTYDAEEFTMPLLHVACSSGDSVMVDFLLKNGANPNIPTRYALAASWAAEKGHVKQIKQCLDNGLDPQIEEMSYWVNKYKKGDKDIPQWMNKVISRVLETDTIPYQNFPYYQFTDPGDYTLLIASIISDEYKKHQLTKELIDAGVNINLINKSGYTALIAAILKLNPSLVKLLIKNGAHVNQLIANPFQTRNDDVLNNHVSPLLFLLIYINDNHELLSQNHDEIISIIKMLKKAGADMSIQTKTEQMSAMDIARQLGDDKIIKAIQK